MNRAIQGFSIGRSVWPLEKNKRKDRVQSKEGFESDLVEGQQTHWGRQWQTKQSRFAMVSKVSAYNILGSIRDYKACSFKERGRWTTNLFWEQDNARLEARLIPFTLRLQHAHLADNHRTNQKTHPSPRRNSSQGPIGSVKVSAALTG